MFDSLPIQVTDLVDVVLVWLMLWAAITWLRRKTSARLALAGLAILAAIFLAARVLGLVLTTWILQGFFAVSVLVVVVVFQQELRRLFEQIATLGPFRRSAPPPGVDAIDTLVRTLAALAQQQRGALVVLPGREPLDRHLDGGVALDARLSEPLLLSIFDPHSAGHDGAVVLLGDRVVSFAVHLPLSTDHAQLGQRGTRHAAALGLSEQTDALCIVVSEERGTISVARAGRLETLRSTQLVAARIRGFVHELSPDEETPPRAWTAVVRHWREGLLALPLAAGLWFIAGPGSSEVETERVVPIQITGLPAGYVLRSVEPDTARVRLSGSRRDLLLLDPNSLEVRVDVILVDLGRRSFAITTDNVVHPDSVKVLSVEPDTVKINLEQEGEEAPEAAAG